MDVLTQNHKFLPYWWEDVSELPETEIDQQEVYDVAIIGSGYTGLNAALKTSRGGLSTIVFDAEKPGWGCSSRNGGQISTSIKPSFAKLAKTYGADRARGIRDEGANALNWIGQFIAEEEIDCNFSKCGRFHAAHSPKHFEELCRESDILFKQDEIETQIVHRKDQLSEQGTDAYYGGLVFPAHCALHPAKYHQGLLKKCIDSGVKVKGNTRILGLVRNKSTFALSSKENTFLAKNIAIATNGYTGFLMPWLRRRVIPIASNIIATEELPEDLMKRFFPKNRIYSDTCKVVYYYRPSPDGKRILFGGRVAATEKGPVESAAKLHQDLCRIFTQMADYKVTHSWQGTVAYTFDEMAHIGQQDGIYYAMGYCGSGVSMASYLGMRMGQKILGLKEGVTAFDNIPFNTRPLYFGNPWFLPAAIAYYRWRDRREWGRAAKIAG